MLNTPLPIIGHVPGWARHLLTFPFIVSAEFVFEDTPRGKRITAWTEDISAYTLIYNVPLAEKVKSGRGEGGVGGGVGGLAGCRPAAEDCAPSPSCPSQRRARAKPPPHSPIPLSLRAIPPLLLPPSCCTQQVWSQAVEPAGGAIATHVGAALDAAAPAVDRFLAERVGWKSGLAQI